MSGSGEPRSQQTGPSCRLALSLHNAPPWPKEATGSSVMASTETIPVIDLGPYLAGEPGALDRTARELRFALTEIGFYFIVNHGVPRQKIRDAFEQVKRFHAQPVEKKMELKLDMHGTGYMPIRGNTL